SDMTDVFNMLDRAAAIHGCSFVIVHHFSKGNQRDKRISDLGAGAGSQSRATDCHIVLKEHAEENHATMAAIVRDFPPFAPMALRCEWPLWYPAPDIDPENTSTHPTLTIDQLLELVPTAPVRRSTFIELTAPKLKSVSKKALSVLLDAAID